MGFFAASAIRPSQDQSRVADLIAAVAGNQRDFGVLDLALRRIGVAHLARAFDDLQHALDMRFRQLAARGVGRQPPAHAQRARCNERAALAFLAEAVILKLREHHVGEAVVDLRGIDVGGSDARHPVRCLAAVLGRRRHHVVVGEPAAQVVEAAEALDRHRRLARSRARSRLVTITAPAASLRRLQSRGRTALRRGAS